MTPPPNEAQTIDAGTAIPGEAPGYMRRPKKTLRQRLRLPLMLAAPIVVVIVGGYAYITGGRYVSTDDAQVGAARVQVSADVNGRVSEVDVKENQLVKAGAVLFKLSPSTYQANFNAAQAQLAGARLRVDALKANYKEKLTELKPAQDTLAYQQHESDRQNKLLGNGIVSQQQFDQTNHTLELARAQVATVQQQVTSALVSLGGNPDLPTEQHPDVQMAQAQLDKAQIDLNDTVIKASVDGTVTKVEQLQIGDYVTAATPVFSLVASNKNWIEADFKETDLTHMRPGQTATVEIDAYPDCSFKARVASFSPGTGSIFSLLPAENASGNWVKVVQRSPVRLELDRNNCNVPLQAGMSANVEVDTNHHRAALGFIDDALAGVSGDKK